MFSYLFILGICLVPFYMIIRDIYLFSKGKYNPYIFREKKKNNFLIPLCIVLGITLGVNLFITNTSLLNISVYSFVFISAFLLICINILNYLSFNKTKDHKIIYHTVISNLTIIIIIYVLVHFTIKAI